MLSGESRRAVSLSTQHSSFITSSRRHQFAGALRQRHAAASLDLLLVLELLERSHGGFHEVLGAGGTVGLGEDVGDTGELDAGSDALAGRDAGAGTRGGEHDRAGAAGALDRVRNRRALEVHLEHALAGVFGGLLDRAGDLVGLSVADADAPLAVAGDDQRTEAERAAALDDLRAAVDADDGRLDARAVIV